MLLDLEWLAPEDAAMITKDRHHYTNRQKTTASAIVALIFCGGIAATCIPTPYTSFISSVVFSMVYIYLTAVHLRAYLHFAILLLAGSSILGVFVFYSEAPNQSNYAFLVRHSY